MDQTRKILKGEPVSAGVAIGKVLLYGAAETEQQEAFFTAGQEEQKLQEWKAAFDAASEELQALVSKLTEEGSAEDLPVWLPEATLSELFYPFTSLRAYGRVMAVVMVGALMLPMLAYIFT